MAFFKLRKGAGETAATPRQPETVEAMRRHARHRLIGAVVLVLIAIIGFPLVFDTQPRPIAVDIPIEIPDRAKVKPLPAPAGARAPSAAVQAAASGSVTASALPKVEASASRAPVPAQAKVESGEPGKPLAIKAEPKPEAKPTDGAKALALLEGKSSASQAAADTRFIVQVGAFSDPSKARETRLKVEHAGIKTYTNVAKTKDGERIRVRVGPFATKSEAEKAAEKIKALDIQAAVLTL